MRITFNCPEIVQAQVWVEVELYSYTLNADIINDIKQRIVDAWNGNDRISSRVQIADEVFASRFYCPVRGLSNTGMLFDIVSIKVRRQTGSGPIVYDSAFDFRTDYLVPKNIPDGEDNPFYEMGPDGFFVPENAAPGAEDTNSMFRVGTDGCLINSCCRRART